MPSTQSLRINNIQPSCPTIVCYFGYGVFYYGQTLTAQQFRRTVLALCCSGTYSGRRCLEIGHGTRLAYGTGFAYNSVLHNTYLNLLHHPSSTHYTPAL